MSDPTPSPIRVCHACEFPTRLGGESSLLALLAGAPRDAIVPAVCAPPGGPLETAVREACVPFIAADTRAPLGAVVASRDSNALLAARVRVLVEASREHRPALLHSNSLMLADVVAAAARVLGVPAVAHVRDILGLSRARVRRLTAGVARFLAVSRAAADALIEQGLPAGKIEVVYNGVDPDTLASQSAAAGTRESTRASFGVPADAPLIAWAGQLGLRKDPLTLIEAVGRLRNDRVPDVHAVLAGSRTSGKNESIAYERSLHDAIARLDLAGRVHLLGWRDDIPALIDAANVLVNSSRQEPLGRTILEAMALARPVVATRVGGTAEAVVEGETCYVVPPADPDAMADALASLLTDRGLAGEMGNAGLSRARERFGIPRAVAATLDVFRSVLRA